jgi:hypothetical protein
MNIIEAVKAAEQNQAIMCLDRNEWLICSGGQLRWKSNRQLANLTVKDIMSEKWISEDSLLTVSKLQIKEHLNLIELGFEPDSGKIEIKNTNKFFEAIQNVSHTNKSRHSGDIAVEV